jgi:hypothetical protein
MKALRNHVCLQVIRTRAVRDSLPVAEWRILASVLLQPAA